jgi:hypothetical protein
MIEYLMNIQFQITPINSLRPSEVLDFGSRHGIYKHQNFLIICF